MPYLRVQPCGKSRAPADARHSTLHKKKLSLRPITLEEAVEAVVQVEPPPKEEKRPVSSTGVGLAD